MGMKKCLCIAQSQNQAAAILGMLREAGINAAIVSTPRRFVNGKTCSYSVEFPSHFIAGVTTVLRSGGLDNEIVCV